MKDIREQILTILKKNIGAYQLCNDDGTEFHFVWQEVSLSDTDSCSFGELT